MEEVKRDYINKQVRRLLGYLLSGSTDYRDECLRRIALAAGLIKEESDYSPRTGPTTLEWLRKNSYLSR